MLTPEQQNLIYAKYQAGTTCNALGDEYEVSRQRIMQIIHRVAAKHGDQLRARKYVPKGVELVSVPEHIIERIRQRSLTKTRAAALAHVHKTTIVKRLKARGIRVDDRNMLETLARDKAIYEQHMAGHTIKQLAHLYNTTPGVMAQRLIRYRRHTGAPKKCISGRKKRISA